MALSGVKYEDVAGIFSIVAPACNLLQNLACALFPGA